MREGTADRDLYAAGCHPGAGHGGGGGRRDEPRRRRQRPRSKSSSAPRPDRVKEISLLGIIVVAMVVFAFLIEGYLSGRFFNRLTTSVVIVAHPRRRPGPGHLQPQHRPLRWLDRRGGRLSDRRLPGLRPGAARWWRSLVAIVVGAVLGSVNGLLVAYGGVPAIIVTLGTLAVVPHPAQRLLGGRQHHSPATCPTGSSSSTT